MLKSFLSLLLVCLAVGCTRYEYDITQPADLATHIGKNEVTVPREPFRYRMQVVENHLIMMIDNPTNDSFQLLGEQSSVVDPTGQSHPLRTVVMAPNSFIKLIFPLERPRYYYPSGPTFGIGVGTVVTHEHRHYFVDDPDYFEDPAPRYLDVVDDNALYWEWKGEGEMRLMLAFQRPNDKPFTHDWLIRRTKQ